MKKIFQNKTIAKKTQRSSKHQKDSTVELSRSIRNSKKPLKLTTPKTRNDNPLHSTFLKSMVFNNSENFSNYDSNYYKQLLKHKTPLEKK